MPKVTKEHREARRRQILEAAIACFTRGGFHRTTMRDICREANLSPGAVYDYFESKEEIVLSIAADRHRREELMVASAREAAGAGAALHDLASAFFSVLADPTEAGHRRLQAQVWGEALANAALLKSVLAGTKRPRKAFERMIADAQARGELTTDVEPEPLARIMLALWQGFVLQQAWEPKADVEAYLVSVRTLVDALRVRAVAP